MNLLQNREKKDAGKQRPNLDGKKPEPDKAKGATKAKQELMNEALKAYCIWEQRTDRPEEWNSMLNALVMASRDGQMEYDPNYDALMQEMQKDGMNKALREAAKQGDCAIIRSLLKDGAEIDATNETKATALMAAAAGGHAKACAFLIRRGANIEAKDHNETTVLMHAALRGHVETCALLLDKGADIHVTDWAGRKAIAYARSGSNKGAAAFISIMMGIEKRQLFLSHFRKCIAS